MLLLIVFVVDVVVIVDVVVVDDVVVVSCSTPFEFFLGKK